MKRLVRGGYWASTHELFWFLAEQKYISMNHLVSINANSSEGLKQDRLKLIVIGGGPVGIKFANELSHLTQRFDVTVFSDEASSPYQRARLSQLLAGQVERNQIDMVLLETPLSRVVYRAIVSIDSESKSLKDSSGQIYHYDYLVFASGARPFIPNIQGVNLNGVFKFRNLKHTESLLARKIGARHVVVVGGGLLGIETACAMNRYNTQVSIVHQGEWLLNRQLDQRAALRLEQRLESEGINVYLNNGVRGIIGKDEKVHSVRFRDGLELNCDTVVLCCGSSPNIELARSARIRVNRGIVVSDDLETSQKNVFAIGECCEHAEQTYGLVTPGYDQANVLANRLAGKEVVYTGSEPQSLLKVLDFPMRTFGQSSGYQKTPFIKEYRYESPTSYFKVVMSRGRVLGAIAIGDIDEFDAVYDAYLRETPLGWFRGRLLNLTGRLWPLKDQDDVENWSDQRIVCRCRQIAVGPIRSALAGGSNTLAQVGETTQAGVTCGSCHNVLIKMLEHQTGDKVRIEPSPLYKTTTVLALFAAAVVTLFWLLPGISVSDTVTSGAILETIWNDKFWKQVTGFSLLGLSVIGLIVSIRKRVNWNLWGKFIYWRFAHIVLGVACVAILLLHTGLHTGSNLNQWLAINFTSVLVLGAFTSVVMAFSHKLQGRKQEVIRKSWNWLHILAVWPLPLLLAAHIITVYKY